MVRRSGPTYYLDERTMGRVGLEDVRRWASIVRRGPEGGYVISLDEVPFIHTGSIWRGERELELHHEFKERLEGLIQENFKKLGVDTY